MKRRLIPLLLILAGCGVALGIAECVVRLVDPHVRDAVIPAGSFAIDADLGWRLHPNTTVTHQTRHFTVTYTTNSFGYRDQPRAAGKNPGQARLLLYGDSQVFGWGVAKPQRFSDLLEARQPSLEVWNLAVPGYGFDQEIISYEKQAGSWQADAVVFTLTGTILERIRVGYLYKKYKPRFVLDPSGALQLIPVPREAATWTSLLYRVFSPLYLPYFVERLLATRDVGSNEAAGLHSYLSDPDLGKLLRAVIERAADVAQGRGQRILLLTTLPLSADPSMRSLCARRAIQVVTVAFPEPREALILGKDDPHWNPQGHRLVAEQFWAQWAGTAVGSD
jgi:hypothetical protein